MKYNYTTYEFSTMSTNAVEIPDGAFFLRADPTTTHTSDGHKEIRLHALVPVTELDEDAPQAELRDWVDKRVLINNEAGGGIEFESGRVVGYNTERGTVQVAFVDQSTESKHVRRVWVHVDRLTTVYDGGM